MTVSFLFNKHNHHVYAFSNNHSNPKTCNICC